MLTRSCAIPRYFTAWLAIRTTSFASSRLKHEPSLNSERPRATLTNDAGIGWVRCLRVASEVLSFEK